jgi:hypothetical protein
VAIERRACRARLTTHRQGQAWRYAASAVTSTSTAAALRACGSRRSRARSRSTSRASLHSAASGWIRRHRVAVLGIAEPGLPVRRDSMGERASSWPLIAGLCRSVASGDSRHARHSCHPPRNMLRGDS